MAERKVYIDYNATTPLRDEIKSILINDLDIFGNASSMHTSGRQARAKVEEARRAVAGLIGALPEEITFSSGGSESNNTVFQTMYLLAASSKSTRNELIVTAIEHPCVLNTALLPLSNIALHDSRLNLAALLLLPLILPSTPD